MSNRVGILYVTFARDHAWLDHSLRSIRKYAKGFSSITVVVPTADMDKFLPYEKRFSTPECPVWIKTFLEYPGKGFVHHLAMKCYADVFMTDCTHILHMDPDCLFSSPVTPQDYFVDNKPVLLIEPFDVLRSRHPARYNWKIAVENALRFEPTHETMCRHPAVHPRWVYGRMREHIEYSHQTPFTDYVIRQKTTYPAGFAEFPCLGAFAMKFFPKDYHFIDREDRGETMDPEPKVWQGWSYQGVDRNMAQISKILA